MDITQIKSIIQASVDTKNLILADEKLQQTMLQLSQAICDCFKADGKVLLCGNGGSAADAQHLAAEFTGRFYHDREPLFAEALHVNTSYLTAVANDYSYDEVYARMVKAKGRKGDVLIGISTSGNSPNVVKAMEVARERGMIVAAFTGAGGGKMKDLCNHLLNVPSTDTPRIQESHIMIGHIVCQLVEEALM